MASYYPKKQTTIIAIVSIFVVIGVFMYTKNNTNGEYSPKNPLPIEDIYIQNPEKTTSTSTDWRSSFITSTTTGNLLNKTVKTTSSEKLTLTDKLGRDFFARYIQMKQSGLIDNQQFVENTLDLSIDNTAQQSEKSISYTDKDIIVSSTITTQSIKDYGNAIAGAFSTHGTDGDPATIAQRAIETGNFAGLAEIDRIIAAYKKILSVIKIVSVPQILTSTHLQLMNGLSKMASISQHIRNVESDPIQAIVSINDYISTQQSILTALRSLRTYFIAIPVTFSQNEPGSLFMSDF